MACVFKANQYLNLPNNGCSCYGLQHAFTVATNGQILSTMDAVVIGCIIFQGRQNPNSGYNGCSCYGLQHAFTGATTGQILGTMDAVVTGYRLSFPGPPLFKYFGHWMQLLWATACIHRGHHLPNSGHDGCSSYGLYNICFPG
jgi:hypothetical protein